MKTSLTLKTLLLSTLTLGLLSSGYAYETDNFDNWIIINTDVESVGSNLNINDEGTDAGGDGLTLDATPQRWVKVVKDGLYMQLAEVEILDAEGNSLTTNATATASSQWDADSGAEKAIDGNTDGVFVNEAMFHSGSTDEAPSLTLALNNTTTIDKIKLWNRTDCCTNRMDNTTIYIADHDITNVDTDTLDADERVTKSRTGAIKNSVTEQTLYGTAFTQAEDYFSTSAKRWVKIVKEGMYIQLAEVEILDADGNSLTENATATASSQWNHYSGAEKTIDGDTDGVFVNQAMFHSGSTDEAPTLTLALNTTTTIDKIKLWNRTDCCNNRMNNMTLYVADYDISAVDTATLNADESVARTRRDAIKNTVTEQTIHGTAFTHRPDIFDKPAKRWVKIVKEGLYMQLAEVEIMSHSGNSIIVGPGIEEWHENHSSITDGATATSSSQWNHHSGAEKTIDGDTDGVFNNQALYHSGNTDEAPSLTIALRHETPISQIGLTNRADCCQDRMTNMTVYVADYDISDVDNATLDADGNVAKSSTIINNIRTQWLYGEDFVDNTKGFMDSSVRENLVAADIEMSGEEGQALPIESSEIEVCSQGTSYCGAPGAIIVIDPPTGGTLTVTENSALSYVPHPNFNGTDSARIRIKDPHYDQYTDVNVSITVAAAPATIEVVSYKLHYLKDIGQDLIDVYIFLQYSASIDVEVTPRFSDGVIIVERGSVSTYDDGIRQARYIQVAVNPGFTGLTAVIFDAEYDNQTTELTVPIIVW